MSHGSFTARARARLSSRTAAEGSSQSSLHGVEPSTANAIESWYRSPVSRLNAMLRARNVLDVVISPTRPARTPALHRALARTFAGAEMLRARLRSNHVSP